MKSSLRVLIRGAGEMASGVAVRLFRSGFPVLMTELVEPLVVRRTVSFAPAVHEEQTWVEEVEGRRGEGFRHAMSILESGAVPVVVDPDGRLTALYHPSILVDATMAKNQPSTRVDDATLVIGLGPGFEVGVHAHYVVETRRGHLLGRVYENGRSAPMDGLPEERGGASVERVLRAPAAGAVRPLVEIGDRVEVGQAVAEVGGESIVAGTAGIVRGMLRAETTIEAGEKVGDIDPLAHDDAIRRVSDKALAVGGGVLEAILRHFGPPTLSPR